MNTVSVLVGGSLGAAAALPTTWLARLTLHSASPATRRLRVALILAGAMLAAAATARHGLATTAALLVALIPATAAAVVDDLEQRLPDALTAATAIAVGAGITALLVAGHAAGPRGAWTFGITAAICLAAKAVNTDAVGWGDVKLAPSLAALLATHGWPVLSAGLLGWSGLILVAAVRGVVRRRPLDVVPYGPALVGGAAVAAALIG